MDITNLSGIEIRDKILNKDISAREVVEHYFENIEKKEAEINAFITLNKDEALKQANRIDEKIKNGEKVGLLAGIPIGIKDNISTKGIKTTCGSKMLENYIPPFDATVVEKIKDQDGIIVGKTNMDEFAMGSTSTTSYFGAAKNPNDTERISGGSSSGSAAAVKAQIPMALGTDTGGSIRQPAAFCGVVGIKPTYGLVSRYGVVPMANSLDQAGTFGRNVEDAALLLQAILGHDEKDSTSMDVGAVDYLEDMKSDIRGMKIGILKEYVDSEIEPTIREKIEESVKVFESLGAEVEEISLPSLRYGVAAYYIISTSELSTNMSRYDGVRYGYRAAHYEDMDELYRKTRSEAFGKEVKRRILMGTYFLSEGHADQYYKKALQARTLIKDDFDRAFKNVDIILGPTTLNLPSKMDEKIDSLTMHKNNLLTSGVNLAGICALSMPCGDIEGLPVGLQLMGDRFKEINILKAAYALEKHLGGVR